MEIFSFDADKGEANFECVQCAYVTPSKDKFERHMNGSHGVMTEFRCDECDFSSIHMSTLEYHKKYSHAKFPCERCEFSAASEGQLARHTEDVHAEGRRARKAKAAPAARDEGGGERIKKRHAGEIERIDDSGSLLFHEANPDSAERDEGEDYVVPMQTVWFTDADSEHQKSNEAEDSGIWEDAPNQSVSPQGGGGEGAESISAPFKKGGTSREGGGSSQLEEVPEKERNYFECDQCNYATASMDEIEDHAADAHGAGRKEFTCDSCPYAASSYYDMALHKKNVKHASRTFKCQNCEFEAATRSDLFKHMWKAHPRKKKTIRTIPPEVDYLDDAGRTERKRKLESIKSFKCHGCPYATNDSRKLNSHVEKFHEEDEEEGVQEGSEGVTGGAEREAAKAIKAAGKFKCDDCDYSNDRNDLLREHRTRAHGGGGAKEFRCETCEYTTHYKRNLIRHAADVHDVHGKAKGGSGGTALAKTEPGQDNKYQKLESGDHKDASDFGDESLGSMSINARDLDVPIESLLQDCEDMIPSGILEQPGIQELIEETSNERWAESGARVKADLENTRPKKKGRPRKRDDLEKGPKTPKQYKPYKTTLGEPSQNLEAAVPAPSATPSDQAQHQCPICKKYYKNSKRREHYASTHFQPALRKFVTTSGGVTTCDICGKSGNSLGGIARHTGLKHNKLLEVVGPEHFHYIKDLRLTVS